MLALPYARRAQRHVVDLPCSIIGPVWDEPVTYQATELSAHGMWVRTSFPFRPGDHVVVQFRPPTAARGPRAWRTFEVNVFARVARAEQGVGQCARLDGRKGMALEFCDLARGERRALQRGLRAVPVLASEAGPERSLAAYLRQVRPARGRW